MTAHACLPVSLRPCPSSVWMSQKRRRSSCDRVWPQTHKAPWPTEVTCMRAAHVHSLMWFVVVSAVRWRSVLRSCQITGFMWQQRVSYWLCHLCKTSGCVTSCDYMFPVVWRASVYIAGLNSPACTCSCSLTERTGWYRLCTILNSVQAACF